MVRLATSQALSLVVRVFGFAHAHGVRYVSVLRQFGFYQNVPPFCVELDGFGIQLAFHADGNIVAGQFDVFELVAIGIDDVVAIFELACAAHADVGRRFFNARRIQHQFDYFFALVGERVE